MTGQYYITHYLQKSWIMLLPLVETSQADKNMQGIINTYLYWEEIDEDILDNRLIVEFRKDCEYGGNENTIASYSTEDSDILVYDLSKWSKDVDKFLCGEYSQYSDVAKLKVLDYMGFKNGRNPKGSDSKHWHSILYPDRYKQEVAGDFVDVLKYFDTKEEAYQVVKTYKEFLASPHIQKETLFKKRTE